MNMPLIIRPAEPARDYARIAALISSIEPQPTSVEGMLDWDTRAGSKRLHRRSVAEDQDGQFLGYSLTLHNPWEAVGRFYIWVACQAELRRRGVGGSLYAATLDFARQHGCTLVTSEVREDDPASLGFAEQRGFRIEAHLFESTIDLQHFDESPFSGVIEAVEAQGIRFSSLAAEGDTEEARRKLHAVNRSTSLDTPGWNGAFPDFEEFDQNVFQAGWYRAAGQIVALDGERYIGLAAVGYFAEDNSMYNMMTGVEAEYRGRGIAQALKLLSIRFARVYGADYIRTHNNSQNAPILAINRKLGYLPQPGIYRLVNELEGPSAQQ